MSNKTRNELLYDKALAAIKTLWEDHSVDMLQAVGNLYTLRDEIEDLIAVTESDIARQEGLTP